VTTFVVHVFLTCIDGADTVPFEDDALIDPESDILFPKDNDNNNNKPQGDGKEGWVLTRVSVMLLNVIVVGVHHSLTFISGSSLCLGVLNLGPLPFPPSWGST
jgi:hypothetical protein